MDDKQDLVKEVGLLANSFKDINAWLVDKFMAMGLNEYSANLVRIAILVVLMIILSWVANYVVKEFIIRILDAFFKKTKSKYDDYLVKRKVFHKLSHLAPAVVVLLMTGVIFYDYPEFSTLLTNVVFVYIVFVFVSSVNSFFKAVDDVYILLILQMRDR